METKQQLIDRIDLVADTQRAKIVGDPVRAFEYQMAEKEAKEFAASGFAEPAPMTVSAWAIAKGWTNQQAAENILQEAAMFNQALYYIRAVRLQYKQAILNMQPEEGESITTFYDRINATFTQAITTLKTIGA